MTDPNQSLAPKTFTAAITSSQKGALLGTILTIPSLQIAQITAQSAASFILIDMEHAPMPIDTVTTMVSTITQLSRGTKHVVIRIPSHGVEWVKWGLDSGADGLIIPMVGNKTEMEAVLDRALYPPNGRRSFGPLYAPFADAVWPSTGVSGYIQRAQRGDVAILPMIESREGLDNVEEILGLDGVSGCFIGPADLRFSLGMSPALDGDEEEFRDAIRRICQVGKGLGKVVGSVAIGEDVTRKRAADGMGFLVVGFDASALGSGIAADLERAGKGLSGVKQ